MKTIKEILTESNGVLKLAVHNGVFMQMMFCA